MPTADIRSEHSGAFLRLRQLWERRSHFSLVLAMVDNPDYRDALIARLDAVQPGARIDLSPADPPAVWLQQGETRCAQGQRRLYVCLPLDTRHDDHWWQQANVVRERLADAMPTLQVVWLSQTDVDTAAHQAPDLWNWREAVLDFRVATRPIPPMFAIDPAAEAWHGIEADAGKKRLVQIEEFLTRQTPASEHDERLSAYLLLQAARLHGQLGNWSQSTVAAQQAAALFQASGDIAHAAEAHAEEAQILQFRGESDQAMAVLTQQVLPVYERLGDVYAKTVTMGRIADILQASDKLDEALKIRCEQELPIYERLGDVRSKAVTMSKIADIHQVRGQLDEALRIRHEEVLPVYERLGDVRSKAITMGRIASILQARGQFDEALHIHREEELPVYERLGDAYAKAGTLDKIADIFQARGQFDQALSLRREEALPVYEHLGDVRSLLVGRAKLAILLVERGQTQDRVEAARLLSQAHIAARGMHPEADHIAALYQTVFGRPIVDATNQAS